MGTNITLSANENTK